MSRENLLSVAEATCLWLTDNFDGCLQTLQKLEATGGKNAKLTHNLCVAEYYCGALDAKQLKEQLGELSQGERAEVDDGEAGARPRSSGPEAMPLCTGPVEHAVPLLNKAILLYREQQHAAAAELLEQLYANIEALYEGTAVRIMALLLDIYIETRQLPRAISLLHHFEKSYMQLLSTYVNNKEMVPTAAGAAATGGAAASRLSDGGAGADAASGSTPGRDVGSPAGAAACPASSSAAGSASGSRCRTLSLPSVSRWCSAPMERSRALLEQQGSPLAIPDLKLLIKLYRTRLHVLAHNTRAAKRELKTVLSLEPYHPTAAMMRAQLELCRGRSKKATKLLLALMQEPGMPPSQRALLLNALGLVHHQQGKHQLALLYLSQARELAGQQQQAPAVPAAAGANGVGPAGSSSSSSGAAATLACHQGLSTVLPQPAVLYNAGLQHLMLHNHAAALECFRQAGALYFHHPLLWLRIAESALGLYRQQQEQAQDAAGSCSNSQQQAALQQGAAAQAGPASSPATAAAPASTTAGSSASGNGASLPVPGSGPPSELLQEAVAALQLALQQLDAQEELHGQWRSSVLEESSTAALASGANSVGAELQVLVLQQDSQDAGAAGAAAHGGAAYVAAALAEENGRPLANGSSEGQGHGTDSSAALAEELALVRHAVLANLAYAHLQVCDWPGALQASQALLAAVGGPNSQLQPQQSPLQQQQPGQQQYAYLATCYLSEALCHMGRPAEAVEALSLWLMQAQEADAAAAAVQPAVRSGSSQKSDDDSGQREVYPLGNAAALLGLSGPAALSSAYTNLAAVFASQGELSQAQALVRQALALQPGCRRSLLLLLYCQLVLGDVSGALMLLKQAGPCVPGAARP